MMEHLKKNSHKKLFRTVLESFASSFQKAFSGAFKKYLKLSKAIKKLS
jgi:hypothetical protein